uniref:Snake toxin/toxin-like domain-containing protein n=1 Tax=Chrysolophus pictus TaxID=9089 RepID=A0A8C3LUM1_CHRPC
RFSTSSSCTWDSAAPPWCRQHAAGRGSALPHRSSPCAGATLRCHKCVASNENDCNKQGSHSCPQYADACSTITAPNSIIKSCSYKSFCDQARRSSGGATLHCCFSDDCNGPRGSRSSGAATMPQLPCLLAAGLVGTLLLGVP